MSIVNQTEIGNSTLSNITDYTNLNETDLSNSTLSDNSSDIHSNQTDIEVIPEEVIPTRFQMNNDTVISDFITIDDHDN